MAAKATKAAKSAAPAKADEAPVTATPPAKASAPKATEPTAAAPDSSEDEAGADEPVPMNRAERRAKGRGQSLSQVPGGRGKVSGSHGPAQAQRNWANRRSG